MSDNRLEGYGSFTVPQDFKAADMSYARSETPASMLIAGTQSNRGKVMRYSLDGKSLMALGSKDVLSGVDSGASVRTVYVATSDSNEIYKLDLQSRRLSFIARIDNATKLGPVAFDEAGQNIYVADVASGKVYLYSIATKSSKIFLTDLSAPTALALEAETSRLFIADPGRRGIFVADTRASSPVAAPFASKPLRSPYGMTLISKGRVAVADYSANVIFVFSGGEHCFSASRRESDLLRDHNARDHSDVSHASCNELIFGST